MRNQINVLLSRRDAARRVLGAIGLLPLAAKANQGGNAAAPPPAARQKKLAAGEAQAKRLLLLMDADKNGKVSKEEFMSFMEAEFERLDVNKDGQLDVRELTQTQIHWRGGVHR